jgi:DNA-binding MarR family transcriptional regulator
MYFNTAALARRLENEWATAFKPFGLAPPQAFMLRAVLKSPGISVSQLAIDLSVSKPTVTRALNGLAVKGLIKREPIEHDARQIAVCPTNEAKQIDSAINKASANVTKKLKNLLGDEIFVEFVKEVRTIRTALK